MAPHPAVFAFGGVAAAGGGVARVEAAPSRGVVDKPSLRTPG